MDIGYAILFNATEFDKWARDVEDNIKYFTRKKPKDYPVIVYWADFYDNAYPDFGYDFIYPSSYDPYYGMCFSETSSKKGT